MDDLISRQAAISAICNACGKIDCDKMDKCEKLQLPPANSSEIPNSSDTISRQQAIDALDCINGAEEVLRSLPPAQPEPQWIPVSERLPEKGGEYLVSVRWYREDDIDIDVYDYDARCKEWNDGESCGQRVIAWMPLPVVYKPNK